MTGTDQSEPLRRDELMASAIELAGKRLQLHPEKDSFREELLEVAAGQAIEHLAPGASFQQTGHSTTSIPTWDRKLGDFDLKVTLPGEEQPSIFIEAKVDDISDTLWDLFKLTAVPLLSGAVAGYLVVAATHSRWETGGDCFELYAPNPRIQRWSAGKLFLSWDKAWKELTGPRGGKARPLSVPGHIETTFIGATDVVVFPDHEVRCIRVRPLGTFRVPFIDGVPKFGEEGDDVLSEVEERMSQ